MSGKKVWWEITWDVSTFPGMPGELVYTEYVKARHPQIALEKAAYRFVEKMEWVIRNKWTSIGGSKTGALLLNGRAIQAGRTIDQLTPRPINSLRELVSGSIAGAVLFSSRARQVERMIGQKRDEAPAKIEPDPIISRRLTQLYCPHQRTHTGRRTVGHLAVQRVRACMDCGQEKFLGWWQEGDEI